MKRFRRLSSAAVLTLILSFSVFAGDISTPGRNGELGTPGIAGELGTPGIAGELGTPGIAGDISTPGFVELLIALIGF